MSTTLPTIDDITTAAKRIKGLVHETPLLGCETIDAFFQSEILFKCENFQKVGAFKSRGACNAVFSLNEKQLSRGVGTHSSGNHAQALARAAALRNTNAYIVMPETAPSVKVEAVRHYGGKITFCKPTLESREHTLAEIIRETGAVEIHPYNDYRVIAGQATVALEALRQAGDLDIIMAPVGGGGLLSGTALTTRYLSSKTRVVAAEPEMANDAYRSFHERKFIPSENPRTIADGLLTSLGSLTYPIILDYVDDIVTVSESSIIKAMRLVWERMKIIIEPSAAVPLGSLLEGKVDIKNKRVIIILSGGNVNLDKLPWIK
jgi:threonine dehydratase